MAKAYKAKGDSKEPVVSEGEIKHIVIAEFRDIKDFSKLYTVGSDVSHLDVERIEGWIKSGLVKRDDK